MGEAGASLHGQEGQGSLLRRLQEAAVWDPESAPSRILAHQQAAKARLAPIRWLALRQLRAAEDCACVPHRGAPAGEEGAQGAGLDKGLSTSFFSPHSRQLCPGLCPVPQTARFVHGPPMRSFFGPSVDLYRGISLFN